MIIKPKVGMWLGMFRHMGLSSADKIVSGVGPTYLLLEDCEGGKGTWTNDVGTPNYAYQPALVGTYSFGFGIAANACAWKDFSAPADPIYGFAKVKFPVLVDPSNPIVTMQAALNGDGYFAVGITISGTVFTVKCGTVEAKTEITPNTTDTFSLWWECNHAAQTASVWIAVNSETKPGSPAATASSGNSGDVAAGIYITGSNATQQVVIDKLRIDDIAIGSDPT